MSIDRPIEKYEPKHEYLVCIDSDGCIFDTMEIKHKECFCPATIYNWGLQAISKYARDAWEYVNLYSKSRGINRFYALIEVLDLLSARKEVHDRNFVMPDYVALKEWVKRAAVLNNHELEKEISDPVLARTYEWSLDINRRVGHMVFDVPPFPYVRKSLDELNTFADIVIVSATPKQALWNEWHEHNLEHYVAFLGAQEDGSKREIIDSVKDFYNNEKIIMIGDAPGDFNAADGAGVMFYPINPGAEEKSWEDFYREIIDLFKDGTYALSEMKKRKEEFDKVLPSSPPWL